jgi:hypothetical protein
LRHPILTFGRRTAPHRGLEDIVDKLALANGVPLADTRITGWTSISVIVQLVRDGLGVAATDARMRRFSCSARRTRHGGCHEYCE